MVDQALGVLMAVWRLPPTDGWDVLREVSQHLNTKLSSVAEHVIGWALGQPMPTQVRQELQERVSQRKGA
ncbi:ANTAR domain-containing protein [Streptomyces glomeratus]|uniref:ANTAR domain-containing protein n=1 Tax=Streptomyces glomeratus TaxID=284452 RepID=UPI001F30265E|nr:ANTAR domain-containing protein [Streptomyces glomeratus]